MLKTFMITMNLFATETSLIKIHEQFENHAFCEESIGNFNTSEKIAKLCITFPPCEWEDSENCYWDALNVGNGIGQSFVDINGKVHFTHIE